MLKYNCEQRREYLSFTRKIGTEWIEIFSGDTEFYSSYYWDLLSEMWYANKPLMVSDALKSMRGIKSPFTARKYLQKMIDKGIVIGTKNPQDERSMLVSLDPRLRDKLDLFFDKLLDNLRNTISRIYDKK